MNFNSFIYLFFLRYVNFTWGNGRIIPRGSDYISIRWTGVLKAAWGLTYFKINADDHARLWINGDLKIDHCIYL